MQTAHRQVHEPLVAFIACVSSVWCFGLAACWADAELGSRWMLSSLPAPALELADTLWGFAVNVYPPFQGCCYL